MLYTIRLSIPGIPPLAAEGPTLFSCLGSFFTKLDQVGEGCDAALEVQEDITKAIPPLLPLISRGNVGPFTHCLELGGTIVMDLQGVVYEEHDGTPCDQRPLHGGNYSSGYGDLG